MDAFLFLKDKLYNLRMLNLQPLRFAEKTLRFRVRSPRPQFSILRCAKRYLSSRKYAKPRLAGGWVSRFLRMLMAIRTITVTT